MSLICFINNNIMPTLVCTPRGRRASVVRRRRGLTSVQTVYSGRFCCTKYQAHPCPHPSRPPSPPLRPPDSNRAPSPRPPPHTARVNELGPRRAARPFSGPCRSTNCASFGSQVCMLGRGYVGFFPSFFTYVCPYARLVLMFFFMYRVPPQRA